MTQLVALEADITTLEVDAIVNSANTRMKHLAGVARAILNAGGPDVDSACQECIAELGQLPIGAVLATTAGDMPSKWVLHTVIMELGKPPDGYAIAAGTGSTLMSAELHDVKTLAFPAFGTGVGGFDVKGAAKIMVGVTRKWLELGETSLEQIYFTVQGAKSLAAFQEAILYAA